MKAELTVDYHIKTVWYAISRMYNVNASNLDMSMAVGYVLLNIDKKGTPATKIAPALGLEPRSLTRMLKNLEDKGWIFRQADDTDKRIVNVYLTETGRQQRRMAREGVIAFNDLVYEKIGEQRIKELIVTMQGIAEIVDTQTAQLRENAELNAELIEA